MHKSRLVTFEEDEWSDDEILESALWGEKEKGRKGKKPFYRPRLIYLFIFLVTYFLAGSISDFPTTYRLLEVYERLGYSDSIQRATSLVGNLKFVYALSHFLTVPINAMLTNHFGRKPFFALSLLAICIDKAALIVIPPIPILYFTKTLAGIFDCAWLCGLVSVADIVSPKNRAFGFSLLGVGTGMTFLGPPMIAGWISDHMGYITCIQVGLGIYAVAFTILMIMPEPNRKPLLEPIKFTDVNPFSAFSILGFNKTVVVLAVIQSLNLFALEGMVTIFTSWLKWQWPDLSNLIYSSFSSANGVALLLSGPITKFVVPKIGERLACSIGLPIASLAISSFGFVVYVAPLSTSWKIVYGILFVRVLTFSVASVTLQSYSTKFFSAVDQVRLLSGLSAVKTLGTMFASLVFPPIFNYFIDPERGSKVTGAPVFWITGSIVFLNSIVLIPFFLCVKQNPPSEDRISLIGNEEKVVSDEDEENSQESHTWNSKKSINPELHHLSNFDRASTMHN